MRDVQIVDSLFAFSELHHKATCLVIVRHELKVLLRRFAHSLREVQLVGLFLLVVMGSLVYEVDCALLMLHRGEGSHQPANVAQGLEFYGLFVHQRRNHDLHSL